ncbi:mitochondrial peptidyl-tRNA hydrolase [Nemania serpens]|nr:mitochondrial peptidyl-tRNA hydrolase [Nemania serpens]
MRFLVVSLGNQEPYFNCLHSAGHHALAAAQKLLAPSQPPFASEKYGKKRCKVSSGLPYTFVQSPTMMNISGHFVLAALKETAARHQLQPSELALVVVHDELEAPLGDVQVRKWERSHRGHNGVKSALLTLREYLQVSQRHWRRISVGIGRPAARTPDVVSDYVLRKMTSHEINTISNKAGPSLVRCLGELQDRWRDDHE